MDLTQRNLAPAVPCILILRIIAEAKNMDQVKRATRWFLKVGEEGFRFKQTNQFVEFMRRAMNLRRGVGASWDGWGVWRASEDHTLVAQGSNLGWNREGSPYQYGNRRRGQEQDQRQVAKSSRCDDRRGGRDRRWPGKTGRGKKGPEPRGEMNALDAASWGTGQSLVPREGAANQRDWLRRLLAVSPKGPLGEGLPSKLYRKE